MRSSPHTRPSDLYPSAQPAEGEGGLIFRVERTRGQTAPNARARQRNPVPNPGGTKSPARARSRTKLRSVGAEKAGASGARLPRAPLALPDAPLPSCADPRRYRPASLLRKTPPLGTASPHVATMSKMRRLAERVCDGWRRVFHSCCWLSTARCNATTPAPSAGNAWRARAPAADSWNRSPGRRAVPAVRPAAHRPAVR